MSEIKLINDALNAHARVLDGTKIDYQRINAAMVLAHAGMRVDTIGTGALTMEGTTLLHVCAYDAMLWAQIVAGDIAPLQDICARAQDRMVRLTTPGEHNKKFAQMMAGLPLIHQDPVF